MKKRWGALLLLALLIAALFFPAVKLHVHSQLGAETVALFPQTVSVLDVAFKPQGGLPTAQTPALTLIDFQSWMFMAGAGLMLLAGLTALWQKRGALHLAAVFSASGMLLLLTWAFHVQNIGGALLFDLLLEPQGWVFVPAVAAAVQTVVIFLCMKGEEPLAFTDVTMRRMGGVLALLAALTMLLPAHVATAPETITAGGADAKAMTRSLSLLDEALATEPMLSEIAQTQGVFSDVLTGDLAALEPYSADGNNIKGIFAIKTSTTSVNGMVLACGVLLLLAAVLAFLPKVDRWFPMALTGLAAVLLCASVTGIVSIGSGDMFATATRQLCKLGVGHTTIVPMLTAFVALLAFGCGVLSVRYANSPYFVDPIPQGVRLRVVAAALAVLTVVTLMLPGMELSFYKPGKSKVVSTVALTGVDAVTFRTSEDILQPKDSKGKTMYAEQAEGDTLTAGAVQDTMAGLSLAFRLLTLAALVLTLAGLIGLLLKAPKKLLISLFLAAFLLRAVTWLVVTAGMPKAIGAASGTLYLYISLPLLVFAAFFSNFAALAELPKKYKLFLMMLPFLLAVFLFSYLPLYGWSYAFYNYKFGMPMNEQEFVGFKWFTELITNAGHQANILRVMKNTFAMSGLGLLTSWLPMVFAIFLNEITRTRFKKFVQIFTTLPNFISWALVFSFAMCLFSMDTGIYNKFLLSIGAIDQPVAWLNSSEHIWLKMWAWNTWKGLGWGAIMYLAAISGIDQELYEAAKVDGAGRWKQMRYITLPGLLPTFFVLLMLSISNILNNGMDQYVVFQNSMNKNTIEVLDLYVYNITIASKGTSMYSFATAIGILKTVVSVTLLFTANFASKKLRGESIM